MGTGATLTGGFKGGDTLTCTVTPYDGEDIGTPLSTTLKIDNTAPALAGVTLTPTTATETSTLTCTPGAGTDDDGDTVWRRRVRGWRELRDLPGGLHAGVRRRGVRW